MTSTENLATNAKTPTMPTPTPAVPKVASKVASKVPAKAPAKKSVPSTKTAPKPAAKTAVKAPPKAAPKPSVKPKAVKPVKVKKPKLVRDSFTIPKAEYTVLDELKQRAGKLTSPAKKSELLRAGIKALAAMSDVAFLTALKAVPTIKTGRPAQAKGG